VCSSDLNPKTNKVSISDLFKNVRLHYVDIRDYFEYRFFDTLGHIYDIAYDFMTKHYVPANELDIIIHELDATQQHINLIIKIIKSDQNLKKNNSKKKISVIKFEYNNNLEEETLQYLFHKLLTSYKNDNVKNIMNKFINDLEKDLIDYNNKLESVINKFIEHKNLLTNSNGKLIKDENSAYGYHYGLSGFTIRNIIKNIIDEIDMINNNFIDMFMTFMDIYFLRRFLDKDYITNGIAYTGAAHSEIYIYFLVKLFNFKITHASYTKINDFDKLTKEIHKIKSRKELFKITELFSPPVFKQCSDMTNFPDNFL
jgi:hypothetical protein